MLIRFEVAIEEEDVEKLKRCLKEADCEVETNEAAIAELFYLEYGYLNSEQWDERNKVEVTEIEIKK